MNTYYVVTKQGADYLAEADSFVVGDGGAFFYKKKGGGTQELVGAVSEYRSVKLIVQSDD